MVYGKILCPRTLSCHYLKRFCLLITFCPHIWEQNVVCIKCGSMLAETYSRTPDMYPVGVITVDIQQVILFTINLSGRLSVGRAWLGLFTALAEPDQPHNTVGFQFQFTLDCILIVSSRIHENITHENPPIWSGFHGVSCCLECPVKAITPCQTYPGLLTNTAIVVFQTICRLLSFSKLIAGTPVST